MDEAVQKLPPHNLEAEQSVIGSLLIDRDAVIRIASFVKPEDFFRASHALIYQAILDLYNRREPADFVTVVDELERREKLESVGGVAYLSELLNAVPTAVHVEYYGRIVERTATLRRLIDAGTEIVSVGFDESIDVDEALDQAERAIFGVAQKRTVRDFHSIGDVLEQYFDKLDFIQQNRGDLVGVPTGFSDLDKLTGGLQRSDLVILAARPSLGKTSLQLGIAHNAGVKHGKTVAIFSLEMSAEQLVQRLLSMETGVDSHRLRLGYIDDSEWDQISRAFGRLAEAQIFIDDTASISVMELRSKARRLLAENGLDLVIVDYLQLMQGRRSENRVQEISEISRSLKGLARELNVPVLALSQLSRAVETRGDHRPLLSDLRESGCLAGDTLVIDPVSGVPESIASLVGRMDAHVWAIDERFQAGIHHVSRAFSTGIKPLYEVVFASGRRISATSNHPFRTVEGWQALADLAPGSVVATARRLPEPTSPMPVDERELVLLARLIGGHGPALCQPGHDAALEQAWIQTIFALPNDQLARFLSQLWKIDGTGSRSRRAAGTISYWAANRDLAELLQLLLLRFGIVARIRAAADRRARCQVRIVGTSDQAVFRQAILRGEVAAPTPNPSPISRGGEHTDRTRSPLPELEEGPGVRAVTEQLTDATASDVFWDRMIRITPVGDAPVYDLTVPGVHNFLANGIFVHNSIEQDADIVMFIFREDAYDRESEKKGIAEIIVAKHRNGPTDTVNLRFFERTARFADLELYRDPMR